MRGATTVGLSAAPGLSGLWVFGYGSLVWKPPAGAEQNTRLVGYVEGYRRVWCQASTDHRGTPEAPGSVVTLVPDETPGARVWGIAARLSDSDDALELARIIADLDYREKQYDTRLQLPVHAEGGVLLERCITYVGTPKGANWAGERPLLMVAANIAAAHGPSGRNDEYLFRLCEAFRSQLGAERAEPELFELEALVRQLQAEAAAGSHEPLVTARAEAQRDGGTAPSVVLSVASEGS